MSDIQENYNKNKCLLTCLTFTPFVVSIDGILGREVKTILTKLAHRITTKWE